MKKYLYLFSAFIATSAVMMVFEFINSFLFPFPEGLDKNNLEAVRAFAATMPDAALIMVVLGWIFGGILGTWIILKYTKDEKLTYYLAGILTFFALVNNYLYIPSKSWFQVVTLILFFCLAWLTNHYIYKK